MKRICFILLLSLSTLPLFAQNKKGDRFECNFFHCEVLDGAVENIHDGVKNLGNKIKGKIEERKEAHQNRQAEQRRNDQKQAGQRPLEQRPAAQERPSNENKDKFAAIPFEELVAERPSLYFNGQEFYATNISTQNGIIRNVYTSVAGEVLILRQYPGTEDPQPEPWDIGEGYPSNPDKISFYDNSFISNINHGEDRTVSSFRSPDNDSFRDYSIVRTVRLTNNTTQQYIYRFRIKNPSKNNITSNRATDLFKQAFHELELFTPRQLIEGNHSFD